ncbi:chemosensory receptor a [Plakobranchus ocellatus]|uniref:Chemosensory receptor a n=1 Tax=Plakobranchus ocellatus TaxID=259542 RepID=A0AAV3ZI96_9GAST|nr:chemosensory receptor a [Plakobranchus ocellatus]
MATNTDETTGSSNRSLTERVGLIKPLVDLTTFYFVSLCLGQIVTVGIAIMGVFNNIFNLIVFSRLGLNETSNLNFFALALSDLVTVSCYILLGFCYSPLVTYKDLIYLVTPPLQSSLGYGSMITALISIERCVYVTFPLKAKNIYTLRRVLFTLLVSLAYQIIGFVTYYSIMNFELVPSPLSNRSAVLKFTYTDFSAKAEIYALLVFTSVPSLIAFIIVFVSTQVLIAKLTQSATWRKSIAIKSKVDNASSKDEKVVRSVIFICTIYIVCYTPNTLLFIVSSAFPQFHVSDGYLGTLTLTTLFIANFFQTTSSSINIFVYYHMSSKFRKTFRTIFLAIWFRKIV